MPGAYDAGVVLTGDATMGGFGGWEDLLKTPVTSMLDVLPLGKLADMGVGKVVAKSSLGAAWRREPGWPKGVLAHTGALRMGGLALGSIQIGKSMAALRDPAGNPVYDAAGLPVLGKRTISQRTSEAATRMGTGKLLSKVAFSVDSILSKRVRYSTPRSRIWWTRWAS